MTLPPHLAPSATTQPQVAPSPAPAAKLPAPAATGFRDSLFTSNQEPRDVSIEELIDLEQQAEFFVVLGQDDSAIDLLMGHIRSSGGTSPLPYLKLLEIYRRLGDRTTYERTRERFNHRFNAYAPDWDSDLQQGRSLDEYPNIMKRLEATWRTPLDAMAELEALMFRRDGGELFELPAYREVLFLYSMARDLIDHEGGPPTSIDVLLPLREPPSDFEPTTARPHLFTSVGGPSEAAMPHEPPIEVLRASGAVPAAGDEATSVYGVVDLDPTKPVPMDDTLVLRRDNDQRSDFADLPPPKSKS
jgi:pilus assembly protein FimV